MASYKPITKPYEELNERQKLFIEYYIQTLNASESVTKAGYTGKRVCEIGLRLKQQLMPYIQERLDKAGRKKTIADTDEILEMLTRIARGEEKDAFGLDTSNQDKLKALELLGKANQLYVDKVKQDTSLDINVSLVDEDEPELIEGETPLELEEGDE